MFKTIAILLLLTNGYSNTLEKSHSRRKYLIIGSNSIQKIYYSTSSRFSKNHGGRKAIDSEIKSSWVSGKEGPHWIEIDFGAKRLMNKIIVYPGKKVG